MKDQETTQQASLADRKKAFLALYGSRPELTMFTIAIQSGLGLQTLAEELKSDREFYAQTKELCGQRLKKEITEQQAHEEDSKAEA